ncbi:MAG: aldo/keto reductase [Phycisphaeraceae bacterium]
MSTAMLTTATLGRSDLEATRLIYGCMRIVGTWNPAEVDAERRERAKASIRAAVEAGYTHFDHADIYCRGMCEQVFGEYLAESPGLRERIVITTKCGIRFPGDPVNDAPHRYDFSKQHILDSAAKSLQRLGIETIDCYLLHRPDVLMHPEQIAEAFDELHRQGKVRHFGVSNFTIAQLRCLQAALDQPLVCNQIPLHPNRFAAIEDDTLHELHRLRVTPTAWSPVGGGMFATGGRVPAEHADRERLEALLATLDAEAERLGTNRTAVTLAWLMQHPAGVQPIVGTTNGERIREAVSADGLTLEREAWYRIYLAARARKLP